MNNIYVDEQPETCLDCEFCDKRNYCCILMKKDVREYRDECPLAILTERLAEERKKVIERIRELSEIYTEPSSKGFDFDTYILTEENLNKILDKAERGSYE